MKNYTGITDKEKLHLMRQQLATQDRVIVELRKKRMSAVCRAKAFQKHLKDAKRAKELLGFDLSKATEQRDAWNMEWQNQRKAFVEETAAHVKTMRKLDDAHKVGETLGKMWGDECVKSAALTWDMQSEIKRGDWWQRIALLLLLALISGAIGVYAGLRG